MKGPHENNEVYENQGRVHSARLFFGRRPARNYHDGSCSPCHGYEWNSPGGARYQIIPNLLGRWVASFPFGKIIHSTILETPPISFEKVVGISAHYLIGVTLASILVYPHVRVRHRKIAFRTALLYGTATCILPWFVMFPAMGFGVMGHKMENAGMMISFSFVNHLAFGFGIFVWSNFLNGPFFTADRSVLWENRVSP